MAYEPELLPPDTGLHWHPETGNLTCITQRDGALFFNYGVSFYTNAYGIRKGLDPQKGAHLACYLIGLTSAESGEYLGIGEDAVRNSMRALYKQINGRQYKPTRTGQRRALYALDQLAQRDVICLGRKAKPTNKYTPAVCYAVDGYLQRMTLEETADIHGTTANALKEQMKYWHKQAEFPNADAYALHLFMAGLVGEIDYKPELIGMLPSLSPVPPPEAAK